MGNVVDKIAGVLERHRVIDESNSEVVRYGLWLFIFNALSVITALVIGVILGGLIEVIAFILLYKPLRSYVGGYHAKSPMMCYALSTLLTASMVVLMKYAALPIYAAVGVWLISGIFIAILAPVDDEHKPLDEIETKIYRRRAMIVWAIETAVGVALVFANLHQFAAYVAWSMTAVCVMMTISVVKNKAKSSKN
jgi:accessory gene regulator B